MNSSHTSQINVNPMRSLLMPTVPSNIQRSPATSYDLPLKIVVNSKYIGAIIGFGGCSIREISKLSKAKCMVDVHNSTYDENGNPEKIIWITGTSEGCSNACLRIMQVVQGELEKDKATGSHFELKIRVPNQLVGRLIGKGGASVKKIMEETSASVLISDPRGTLDVMHQDPSVHERLITVRANSLDAVSNAERKISQKLRNYYESDLNVAVSPATANFGGIINVPPFMIGSPSPRDGLINGLNTAPNAPAPVFYSPINAFQPNLNITQPHNPIQLKSNIFVSNNVVGALIGAKGFHIRHMMSLTGANISIEGGPDTSKKHKSKEATATVSDNSNANSKNKQTGNSEKTNEDTTSKESENEETNGSAAASAPTKSTSDDKTSTSTKDESTAAPATSSTVTIENNAPKKGNNVPTNSTTNPDERCVTITGYDFQVYKFKAEFWIFQRIAEFTRQFMDELVLTTETFVPSKVIGRIIGKNGQNVRELQRITQATVKVFEDLNNQGEASSETPVRVTGTYFSLQAVQCRFGMLIADSEQRELNESKRSRSTKDPAATTNVNSTAQINTTATVPTTTTAGSPTESNINDNTTTTTTSTTTTVTTVAVSV